MIRKIVEIDERKCNGCGLCVPACAEGAIRIENGKAVLSADNLCDGLGACLGDCPQDAIRVIEREADEFDEKVVEKHLKELGRPSAQPHAVPQPHHGGCPGSRVVMRETSPATAATETEGGNQPSELRQWPVQLHLVPVSAPYFRDADLLIAADCVPFACGSFHRDFLKGKALVIGCPKLDDNGFYLNKLTELFRTASLRSITVVRMEVPCCGGIVAAAREALAACGKEIPLSEVTVTLEGDVKK
jgi:NAD-dependent dihydropyrimidine dehydrogenase PreA subunit